MMKKIIVQIKSVLATIQSESPVLIILCLFMSISQGIASPLIIWASSKIFDIGLLVAQNKVTYGEYIPYLFIFFLSALLPQLIHIIMQSYITPASELIFRTSFKGKMLQKIKKMKYEHLESEESMEIIDKAFTRAEEAALHIFPSYFFRFISSLVSILGLLFLFGTVKFWLVATIVIPFSVDTFFSTKNNFNIYDEMETYWGKEHRYKALEKMLRERHSVMENNLFGSAGYLIKVYKKRLHERNKEFERFYFKNLKHHFLAQNISRISQLLNALILLGIHIRGGLGIGKLISMTTAIFTSLSFELGNLRSVFNQIGYQVKFCEYYDQYFALSEDSYGMLDDIPQHPSIEFNNVSFTYPGSNRKALSDLTFRIEEGETVAIVGKNGNGKTTIIKLLLGLYQPDSGEIKINSIPLNEYSWSAREKMFAPVFQDFTKYDMTFKENIGVGDVTNIDNLDCIHQAMQKANVNQFGDKLPLGVDTILGRRFEGGVDISGGQWQRIAIARAFMGHRPIMILDEPTSQLDPMTESEIYSNFATIANGKTTILITHRLGATTITDRILVIEDGHVSQTGTHQELMQENGIYADMFRAQKEWYTKKET